MLKRLCQTIQAAGKRLEVLETSDGTRMLMFPYGARVLGLFSTQSGESFYWNNPRLEQDATARSLLTSDGWHNTGGDRTWIAPEWDTFFPDANSNAYLQPRQLDMSDYDLERIDGGCQFSRQMKLHLARANRDVNLRLSKWFGPAANPLCHERDVAAIAATVEYAGYTQKVTLQSLDRLATPPSGVGIWNLLQLPAGGEMLVPLYSGATPQKCFGQVPAESVKIEEHLLRVRIDFSGSHKIALKAASVCGRAGYVYARGDRFSLVIRNFFVNPSGEYIDVQRHDPDDYGYAFQMCRVDAPEYGSFCELEYHAPAIGALPDPTRSEETSQVWAFRGCREAIDAVARKLLGATISI
ncbi:MAG: DUF6786 family protein [Thermoguttaceae bacterium]|jgi:hypothetical protein